MKSQVAKITNRQESEIKVIREWAHVYWVSFTSGRPTMISKKAIKILPRNASFSEMKQWLKDAGMWMVQENYASIWGALQVWIHAQKWQSQNEDELINEINQALKKAGLYYGFGVRRTIDAIVSHKLSVNGCVLTFC